MELLSFVGMCAIYLVLIAICIQYCAHFLANSEIKLATKLNTTALIIITISVIVFGVLFYNKPNTSWVNFNNVSMQGMSIDTDHIVTQ